MSTTRTDLPLTLPSPANPSRPSVLTRAAVVVAAVAAALLVWTIASMLLNTPVTVPESPGSDLRHELRTPAVLAMAAGAALAGWALLAILERVTSRSRALWTCIAVAVFMLTLPYLPGYTSQERAVLVLLHGSLAATLVLGLRGPGRAGRHPAG